MKQILIIFLSFVSLIACESPPQVTIDNQTLIGKYHGNTKIASFLGIPFAEPPINNLRWSAPRAFIPKNSMRQATDFASACMQDMGILEWYRDLAEVFGNNRNVVDDLNTSEDCLYLNIWTPTTDDKANLPVMVYIHGGSNNSGWSFEPNYHGYALAQKDVVVVSIAYRLGVFGFISHPEIDNEDAIANFGLWDQIAAFKWVKKNISKFGGNPNRVTAFGESAGAQDILALLFTKPAKDLFHQAILQSNAGFGMVEETDGNGHIESNIDNEKQRGHELSLILSENETPLSLEELKKIPANIILEKYNEYFSSYYHSPAVDGQLIEIATWKDIQQSSLDNVKLIIGSNADEYYANIPESVTNQDILATTQNLYKNQSNKAYEAVKDEQDSRNALDRLYTAEGMLCPSQYLADKINADGGESWVYYFSRIRDGDAAKHKMVRAYHGAELPYVFNTHDHWMTTTEKDLTLTEMLTDYWTQFAKTGNPNAEHAPKWPVFNFSKTSVQNFGDYISTINSPEPILCDLF